MIFFHKPNDGLQTAQCTDQCARPHAMCTWMRQTTAQMTPCTSQFSGYFSTPHLLPLLTKHGGNGNGFFARSFGFCKNWCSSFLFRYIECGSSAIVWSVSVFGVRGWGGGVLIVYHFHVYENERYIGILRVYLSGYRQHAHVFTKVNNLAILHRPYLTKRGLQQVELWQIWSQVTSHWITESRRTMPSFMVPNNRESFQFCSDLP